MKLEDTISPELALEKEISVKLETQDTDSQSDMPVLDESKKNASIFNIAMIWAGSQLMASTWATGALAIAVFGLDLKGGILAIILGNLLGGLMVGTTSLMGRHGAPQMLMTRYSLGIKGASITSFFNFISTIGWVSANTMVAALSCFQILLLLHISTPMPAKVLVLVILIFLQLMFAFTDFKLMKKIETALVIPMTILIIIMTVLATKDVNWTVPVSGFAKGSSFNYFSMWISCVGAVGISFLGSWAPYSSDFSRFYKFKNKKTSVQLFWVTTLVGAAVGTWLESLGAIFSSKFAGADPALHIAKSIPAFAIPAILIILAGTFTGNVLNLINGGLSAKVIWKKGSRNVWTALIGVIALVLVAYSIFVSDIATVFHTFLVALLIWQAPWFAIVTIDYFVIHKKDYKIPDLYRLNNAIPNFNKFGTTAYWIGFVTAALTCCSGSTKLFGVIPLYSPIMMKYFNGMDISFFIGMIVTSVTYLALNKSAIK